MWFFGSILALVLLFGGKLDDESVPTILLFLGGIGLLCAGLIFFITWYDAAKEERELELKERRKALHE